MMQRRTCLVVVGGGPGGYEAALVAAALGARVTLVDADGLGGACVLTDCVPSKALISTAGYLGRVERAAAMGVGAAGAPAPLAAGTDAETDPGSDAGGRRVAGPVDLARINARIRELAAAQSRDIRDRLAQVGVEVVTGRARLLDPRTVAVTTTTGDGGAPAGQAGQTRIEADVVLLATGARPRVLPAARPDGRRILTWTQVWHLPQLPPRLVVVGSGVTGAEFAQAYLGLGSEVTLVSSRDHVLPGEDADAAQVIEDVFRRRGMQVLNRSRMAAVEATGDAVLVTLEDGRRIEGSHALLAVGSVPRTDDLGLAEVGIETGPGGHIVVDRVSRTSLAGVYAAGDCTGVLPLASVAAMQGRLAVAHALGDAVAPLQVRGVAATIFTDPEIATVGVGQAAADEREDLRSVLMPLVTNPRAKMDGLRDGFVKVFARSGSHIIEGAVIVAPGASELIFPLALAVQQRLTVDQVASTITVYPSLSGSLAEASRRLHSPAD